jgi:oligoendopeptidase F
VDVEAGRHNNDPPFRSSIAKIVAEPAGTCIIHNMINENEPTEDQDLDAYWEDIVERYETDSADIGSEFDS